MTRNDLRLTGWVMAALVAAAASGLIAACGGDSATTPAPAPGSPVPAPPPAPSVEGLVITTTPFGPRGYVGGETIGVQVAFSEAVTVSGAPLLKLGIGADLRDAAWDEEASDGASLVFGYVVTLEDLDENGISIGGDALDAGDGTIRNAAGVEADLDIGDHAIADAAAHRVLGPPAEGCGDQRSLALGHEAQFGNHGIVRDWDGTPLRVDLIRNFPDFVTDNDLRELLDPISRLADRIEAQLGYSILEVGGLVEVPSRAPEGWDQDWRRYWSERTLVANPGEILVFYLDDYGAGWGEEGSPMSAHVCCGTTSYNKRALGPMWTGDDPCCQGDANQYTREGQAIVHEVFHLLGFKHYSDQEHLIGVKMSPGGLDSPWESGSLFYHATPSDIENLRCIFPRGG